MTATNDRLGELHEMVTETFIGALGDEEKCTPSMVAAAVRFLKDNHIEVGSADEGAFGRLVRKVGDIDLEALTH
jgi:hypothetical protein